MKANWRRTLGAVTLLLAIQARAEKIDCEIEDNVVGIKKIAKVFTNPGQFNELYDSTAVSYRITEWQPKIGKPPTLLLMIRTPEKTIVATGSIRDYVTALEYEEAKPYRRSLSCHPPL